MLGAEYVPGEAKLSQWPGSTTEAAAKAIRVHHIRVHHIREPELCPNKAPQQSDENGPDPGEISL